MQKKEDIKKLFIDTSVFIRFFTKDDQEKYDDCVKLLELIEKGTIRPYTSNIVLLEIFFVLTSLYKFEKLQVRKSLGIVLQMRNLTLIEKTNTPSALRHFDKYRIKYTDCLIVTQIPKGTRLITYDAEFSKIKSLHPLTPAEVFSAA